jgi:chaperonin GroEL
MYFITDKERLVVRLEDPYLLLCDGKITRVEQLIPVLERVKKSGRSLLVVGEVQGDALSLLVVNKLQGTLNVCAIMPPYYMKTRAAALADLAAQTGGRVVSEADGVVTLANVTLDDLGRAKQVVVDQEKTTILGGADARSTSRRAPERFTPSTKPRARRSNASSSMSGCAVWWAERR